MDTVEVLTRIAVALERANTLVESQMDRVQNSREENLKMHADDVKRVSETNAKFMEQMQAVLELTQRRVTALEATVGVHGAL